MSAVMSTWVRMQATHIFAGFGEIGTPHWQHNLQMFLQKLSNKVT